MLLTVCVGIISVVRGDVIFEYHGNQSAIPLASLSVNKTLSNQEGTFCVKFRIFGSLIDSVVFEDISKNLKLNLKTLSDYGFVHYAKLPMIFKIPPNTIHSYVWFHFCFTKDEKSYSIVVNGKMWYSNDIIIMNVTTLF